LGVGWFFERQPDMIPTTPKKYIQIKHGQWSCSNIEIEKLLKHPEFSEGMMGMRDHDFVGAFIGKEVSYESEFNIANHRCNM